MAINPNIPWTLQQAIDRGFEWYPMEITDFGDVGAGADPVDETGVAATLISNFPVRGIRIAADSLAARCGIRYNPGQQIVLPLSRDLTAPNTIIVTHDQPWFGTLTAPLFVRALLEQMYFDTYTLENGSTTAAFGSAIPAIFISPDLKLDLLLRGSGISPVKRAPFELVNIPFTLTGGGAEDTVRIAPLDGRRRARIVVTNPTGNPAAINFRVTMVQMRSPATEPPAFAQQSTETEIVAATAVAIAATESAVFDPTLGDYMLLKIDTAGAAATIRSSIKLED